jgi:glyoxylase I family protein
MTPQGKEHRITHIGVCVSDLDRAVAFYRDGLGFVERARLTVEGGVSERLLRVSELDLDMVYLEHSGLRIELLHFRSPGLEGGDSTPPVNRVGFTHFSIRVDVLGPMLDRIISTGGQVDRQSYVVFEGGNSGIMAFDPDGTRIELIERVEA